MEKSHAELETSQGAPVRVAAAGRPVTGDSWVRSAGGNRRTHLGQLTGQMLPGEATAEPSGHQQLQCCWISVRWSASGADQPAGWHVGRATHLLTRRAKRMHLPTRPGARSRRRCNTGVPTNTMPALGVAAQPFRAPAASRRATGRSRPLRVLAHARDAHNGFASNILTMQAPLLVRWEGLDTLAPARLPRPRPAPPAANSASWGPGDQHGQRGPRRHGGRRLETGSSGASPTTPAAGCYYPCVPGALAAGCLEHGTGSCGPLRSPPAA